MPSREEQIATDSFASRARFQRLFVLVPGLSGGMLPTLLFGALPGDGVTNLLWGSYFGLGWCLSAFWSGGLMHDSFSTRIGLIWSWAALVPLYFGAGRLWDMSSGRRRVASIRVLLLSGALLVPEGVLFRLESLGVHFPDYMQHLARSF